MRCRYRGTCCPTATPATANLNRRKIYETVIAVILPCIFILVLACAIYLLRDTKKKKNFVDCKNLINQINPLEKGMEA